MRAAWVIAAGLATHVARADDAHVLPCRPTYSCTAELAPPGTIEVELGYQLRRAQGASTHSLPVLAKLPVATWLELQLGTNGPTYVDSDHRYVDNVIAGAKLHLVDQTARRPAIAVTVSSSVPIASQRGFTEAYDLSATGHLSKDLDRLHVDVTGGVYVLQLDSDATVQPWIAVAATYAATPTLGVFVEPHYVADAAPVATRDAGVIAGLGYAPRAQLVLDIAVDAIVLEPRAVIALAGVSFIPARLWQ